MGIEWEGGGGKWRIGRLCVWPTQVAPDEGATDAASQSSGEGSEPERGGGFAAKRQQYRRGLIAQSRSAR